VTRAVFAHGFTQTGRSWDGIIAALRAEVPDLDPVSPDLPGHGVASDDRLDLWASAQRLLAIGGPAAYVGYSMGGRTALHAALLAPHLVDRLVLVGATAGIADDEDRLARRRSDEELADRIEQIGVAAFIENWLQNPLFDGLTNKTAQRPDRLRNTSGGLASSLRLTGTGTQESLWERLDEVECPTLILVGERDTKFRALGERLSAGIRRCITEVIADSGHSVHLEQPEATVAAIANFLR
jgi:2-succinyl-6-hydroxy-2,4-cyclohexadiene-1-carboxylate synthase